MKKQRIAKLLSVIVVISMITIYACKKNPVEEAKYDCHCNESQNYSMVNINLGSYVGDFKCFSGSNDPNSRSDYSFAYNDEKNAANFSSILSFLNLKRYSIDACVVSISVFADKDFQKNLKIDLFDIKGVLIYLKLKNKMYTQVYEKTDKQFVSVEKLNTVTSYISSNDAHIVSNYFGSSNNRICISLIDFKSIPKIDAPYPSKFQLALKNLSLNSSGHRMEQQNGGNDCQSPCEHKTKNTRCVAHEPEGGFEHWYCSPCLMNSEGGIGDFIYPGDARLMFHSTTAADSLAFTVGEFDAMYNFRDSFLLNISNGENYVSSYYYVSEQLVGHINIDYAIAAYTILTSDVLPIINTVMTNPASSDILYDYDCANRMIAFLDLTESFITDDLAIEKIESLKADITANIDAKVVDILDTFE